MDALEELGTKKKVVILIKMILQQTECISKMGYRISDKFPVDLSREILCHRVCSA